MASLHSILLEMQKDHQDLAIPVVVVKSLLKFTALTDCKTLSEYMNLIKQETIVIRKMSISYQAGLDLFTSFLQSNKTAFVDFKKEIIRLGEDLVKESEEYRNQASEVGVAFVQENSTILIHSYSR